MLYLRTLGAVILLDDGTRVLVRDQRMRLALLALLAMAGEGGMSRDKIVAFLWPESSTENARHALHQLLYYLRRDSSPDLFVGMDPLSLNPQVVTSDVARFSDALRSGSLEDAVALYGGPFLDGFFIKGAEEFEKWTDTHRARLHADYTRALYRLAQAADARGDHALAIERWRTLVAAEPLDARGTLGWMRALAAAGDPVTAVRQARVYEQLVRAETGQAPAPEVSALARELMAADDAQPLPRETAARPAVDEAEGAAEAAVPSALPSSRERRRAAGRWLTTALTATIVLFVVAGSYAAFSAFDVVSPAVPAAPGAAPAVAVLPFGVHDPALATWREGALVVVATDIDGVGGLRAIPALSRARVSTAPELAAPSPTAALAIARRVGADHALVGNIVAIGSAVRITADLYDAESGERFRQLQVDGVPERMFALLDALSLDVVRSILPRTGKDGAEDLSRVEVARHTTSSLPALKAYLEGEKWYQQSRFAEARDWYGRALEADSAFALMLTRFLVPYSFVNQAAPRSISDPLAHALRMLDRLPRREALLVRANSELERENLPQAFELLRQASSEYPDDYEVWYSLGEVALHRGGDLLLRPDEAIRAFTNSVQLNPRFGPPYSHLIEVTLAYRGDAERTAEITSAYERAVPAAENVNLGGLALALATGNASRRERALQVLDTLPLFLVQEVVVFLRHPRFRAAQERALTVLEARASKEAEGGDHRYDVRALVSRGRLAEAAATSLKTDACAPLAIYWMSLLGLTQLPAEAEAALHPRVASSFSCSRSSLFVAGGFAVDRARWSDVDSVRTSLASAAADRRARGDSVNALQFVLWAEALRGYRLARSGHVDEGIRVLETVQPRLASQINEIVRWWLATLLSPMRPRDARRYFESFWHTFYDVPAAYELARIDERMGHTAEARAAYQRFAIAWRDADAAVQPRVAAARARLTAMQRQGGR